jgi:hypothetical protein
MMEVLSQWPAVVLTWLLYELLSQLVSHPVDATTNQPVRPPISVTDYLLYNPGVLRNTEAEQ